MQRATLSTVAVEARGFSLFLEQSLYGRVGCSKIDADDTVIGVCQMDKKLIVLASSAR